MNTVIDSAPTQNDQFQMPREMENWACFKETSVKYNKSHIRIFCLCILVKMYQHKILNEILNKITICKNYLLSHLKVLLHAHVMSTSTNSVCLVQVKNLYLVFMLKVKLQSRTCPRCIPWPRMCVDYNVTLLPSRKSSGIIIHDIKCK